MSSSSSSSSSSPPMSSCASAKRLLAVCRAPTRRSGGVELPTVHDKTSWLRQLRAKLSLLAARLKQQRSALDSLKMKLNATRKDSHDLGAKQQLATLQVSIARTASCVLFASR